MRKVMSIILLAAMLVTACACAGDDPAGSADTTVGGAVNAVTAAPETTVPEDTEPPIVYPDLTGFTLNVAKIDQSKVSWSDNTFVVADMNGDVLNDALYKRNSTIEAETGAKIEEESFTDVKSVIRKNSQANDSTYHLYMERIREMGSMTAEGYFYDIHDVGGLNLEMPWWDQDFIEDTSVMGKNYMLVGDLLLTTADCLYSIIYDKEVARDVGITDLYQVVRDGKWTLEQMTTYMAQVTNDLNGDSKYDYNDRYGLISVPVADPIFAFIIASDLNAFTLQADGTPELSAKSEKFSTMFERLQTIYNGDDYFSLNDYDGLKNAQAITALFSGKQALFLPQCISAGGNYLRDLDHDFGFLPTPKYDEAQEKYLSHVNMAAPVFFVPLTNGEADKTGALLEVLSHYSHEHVMDVYYETCFSAKFARDEESYEMLQLALENKVYDLGFVWKWGDFMNKIAALIENKSASLSSTIATLEKLVNADIEDTLAALKD